MNKVLPGFYLGNYRDSKDPSQLERHRITHILAIHDAPRRLFPEKEYLCIMASDSPLQNLSQYFSLCNDFIHSARITGGNVLVHCLAGMSRSVTIAVAYVMSITVFPLPDANKIVRGARPVSNPNTGFQRQLQDFESTSKLFEERRRMLEKFSGTTFTESDTEHCRRLLLSYNNLMLSRSMAHHSTRPSPAAMAARRQNSQTGSAVSSLPPSAQSSPRPSPKRVQDSPRPIRRAQLSPTQAIAIPPSPPQSQPWERHYGCWKEHARFKVLPTSSPVSPAHFRVSPTSRTDSMASIGSVTFQSQSPPSPSIALLGSPGLRHSSVHGPIRKESIRRPSSTTSTPEQSHRQLPSPSPSSSSSSGPRSLSRSLRSRHLDLSQEEDEETLTVVLEPEPQTSSTGLTSLQKRSRTSLMSRSWRGSGIRRWVMKRSSLGRYSSDDNP